MQLANFTFTDCLKALFVFFFFFKKTLSIILIIKYKSNKSKYTVINNLLG